MMLARCSIDCQREIYKIKVAGLKPHKYEFEYERVSLLGVKRDLKQRNGNFIN